VSKGGTGATDAVNGLYNLLPAGGTDNQCLGITGTTPTWKSFADLLPAYTSSDNGKVLGLTGMGVDWVEQTGGMVPDYSQMPSSPSGGTFSSATVNANGETSGAIYDVLQDGFVSTRIMTVNSPTNARLQYAVKINTKSFYIRDGLGAGVHVDVSALFPVKTGDTVQLVVYTNGATFDGVTVGSTGVYFIPPMAVTPPQLNENYSTDEINTGKKWLNGETIYRKTYTGEISESINTSNEVIIHAGVKQLLNVSGYWHYRDTAPALMAIFGNEFDFVDSRVIAFGDSASNRGDVQLITVSNYVRTDRPYYLTLEYTKITD
jgi:hypothetical protein